MVPCLTTHLGCTLCASFLYAWSCRRLCRLWTHYTNLGVGWGFGSRGLGWLEKARALDVRPTLDLGDWGGSMGVGRGGSGRFTWIDPGTGSTEPGCMEMLQYLTQIIFTWVLSSNCYTEYEYHIQHITDSCGFFFYSKTYHFTIFFLCCLDARRIMHSQN